MKKPYRQADGFYHVDGKLYKTLFGSREQVMNGSVHKTTGGLTKADLVMNKWGRIVSAKKFKTAKKEMRLQKHGFFAKKGKFGAVTRKMRGGADPVAAGPPVDPPVVAPVVAPAVAGPPVAGPPVAGPPVAGPPVAGPPVVDNTPDATQVSDVTTKPPSPAISVGGKSKKSRKHR